MVKAKNPPPGRIVFKDEAGQRIEISVPSLCSLFWSDKLQRAYERDPNKTYSVKDLVEMMDPGFKCSEAALRNHIRFHVRIFKKQEDGEIRVTKQGITSVNVSKLNPIVRYIFDTVQDLKKATESFKER